MHPDGVRVHDLDALDRREEGRAAELPLAAREALEAPLRRLGVEVLPVVELDALAELDLPGRRSHELRHLGRERGDDLEALVPLVERVEDVATQVRCGCLRLVHHVERRRVHALRDDDLARGSGGRPERDEEREGQSHEGLAKGH